MCVGKSTRCFTGGHLAAIVRQTFENHNWYWAKNFTRARVILVTKKDRHPLKISYVKSSTTLSMIANILVATKIYIHV